jgi:hypothetical protein
MENNKQTAVNYLLSHIWTTDWVNYTREQKLAIIEQAKEMEIAGKEMSYSDGYKEGYHRAIENAKYQINKWIDKELKITQQ